MKTIAEVLNQEQVTNLTQANTQTDSQKLAIYSKKKGNDGSINALDLIGDKVSANDLLIAEEMVRMNFGIDYPKEKFQMLWKLILEEGWTNFRLKETLKWFLKNKHYASWTIADWFDYEVKLYPYSKYVEEVHKHGAKINSEIEWYDVNGTKMWKWKDGNSLPLQKIS